LRSLSSGWQESLLAIQLWYGIDLLLTLTWLTKYQEFVAAPALAPPTATVDQALLEQYQKEMQDAAQMPLPDEDDADL
jgi:hypothetical protein